MDNALKTFLNTAGYQAFDAGHGDVRLFVAGLIQTVLSVTGIIFLIIMIYAGFLWLTAAGNEEQVTKAQKFLTQAIIGFIITLAAFVITRFIIGIIEAPLAREAGTLYIQQP